MTESDLLAELIAAGVAEALRNDDRHTKWRTGLVTSVVQSTTDGPRQVEMQIDGDPPSLTTRVRSFGGAEPGQRALVVFTPGGGVWCLGAIGAAETIPTVPLTGGCPLVLVGEVAPGSFVSWTNTAGHDHPTTLTVPCTAGVPILFQFNPAMRWGATTSGTLNVINAAATGNFVPYHLYHETRTAGQYIERTIWASITPTASGVVTAKLNFQLAATATSGSHELDCTDDILIRAFSTGDCAEPGVPVVGLSEWDAFVVPDLAANDLTTTPPQFTTPYEAIYHVVMVAGKNDARIGVFPRKGSENVTIFTETRSDLAIEILYDHQTVSLHGLSAWEPLMAGREGPYPQTPASILWNLDTTEFPLSDYPAGSGLQHLHLENLSIMRVGPKRFFFGASAQNPNYVVYADHCRFYGTMSGSGSARRLVDTGPGEFRDCYFQDAFPDHDRYEGDNIIEDCVVKLDGGTVNLGGFLPGNYYVENLRIDNGASSNLTMKWELWGTETHVWRNISVIPGGAGPYDVTLEFTGRSFYGDGGTRIDVSGIQARAGGWDHAPSVKISHPSYKRLRLGGTLRNVTIAWAEAGTNPAYIPNPYLEVMLDDVELRGLATLTAIPYSTAVGSLTVSGRVQVDAAPGRGIIVTNGTVNLDVTARVVTDGSYTLLDLNNVDGGLVRMVARGGWPAAATSVVPYNIDAASSHGILTYASDGNLAAGVNSSAWTIQAAP